MTAGRCAISAETNSLPAEQPPAIALNLETCLAMAVDQAKNTGRLGQSMALATAFSQEARSKSWPKLNIHAGIRYETRNADTLPEADGDFGNTFLELPQNIVRRRIATLHMACAKHYETRALCIIQARILRVYAGLLRADANLNLAEERLILSDQLETAWQRVPEDASLAKRKKESLAMTRNQPLLHEQAQLEQMMAAKRFFIMTGLADSHAATSIANLPDYKPPSNLTAERCLEWALKQRSDLQALNEQIRLQTEAIRLARMARLPSPMLSFGYRDSSDTDHDNATDGMYLKAMLKIPIWDAGEINAQTAKLAIERTRSLLERDDLQAEIAAATARSYGAWRRAVENHAEAVRNADSAKPAQRQAEIRHALGDLSTTQYQTELLRIHELAWTCMDANLACFEAESDLLENIQADQACFATGLKEQP